MSVTFFNFCPLLDIPIAAIFGGDILATSSSTYNERKTRSFSAAGDRQVNNQWSTGHQITAVSGFVFELM